MRALYAKGRGPHYAYIETEMRRLLKTLVEIFLAHLRAIPVVIIPESKMCQPQNPEFRNNPENIHTCYNAQVLLKRK